MNEFIIVDSEGVTHWISTCMSCYSLVERSDLYDHMTECVRRTVAS